MQSTETLSVIGMDIAKNVFQPHVLDAETGEVTRHKLRRDRVTTFFANRRKSLVAMEACGGAHHWARALQALGHEVKLLPAKHVRPFVLRDKTNARDAQAIWVAAQQPHIKAVPVKNEQQQACLTLNRMRAQLMKVRIMQTNALRGLLYEFGIVLPQGHCALLKRVQDELAPAGRIGSWGSPNAVTPYVRTLLMHGARAVIARGQRSGWIQRLLLRRPYSVLVAALANKLARTAWAVLVKGKASSLKNPRTPHEH
jgi:transposase